jgi:sugar (pentulose or hexulose) kinase
MSPVVGLDLGTRNIELFTHDAEARRVIAAETQSLTWIANHDVGPEQKSEWCLDAARECFTKLDADFRARIVASGHSCRQRQPHAK